MQSCPNCNKAVLNIHRFALIYGPAPDGKTVIGARHIDCDNPTANAADPKMDKFVKGDVVVNKLDEGGKH